MEGWAGTAYNGVERVYTSPALAFCGMYMYLLPATKTFWIAARNHAAMTGKTGN